MAQKVFSLSAGSLQDSGNPSVESPNITLTAERPEELWKSTLLEVWEDGIVTDMTLIVADKQFHVHRLVMLMYSSYLKRIIKKADPTKTPLVSKLNLDPVMVKKALDFVYKGNVGVAKSQLQDLAEVADNLGIGSLLKCVVKEQLRGTEVTLENCLPVWEAASEVGCEEITKEAKAVALLNFDSLQHSHSFEVLSFKLTLEYLTDADLILSAAEERLSAALYWVKADPTARHRHLSPLLDSLPLTDMGWFLNHVLHESLIQNSPDARQRIERAKKEAARPKKKHPKEMCKGVSKAVMQVQPKTDSTRPRATSQHKSEADLLVFTDHGKRDDSCNNEAVEYPDARERKEEAKKAVPRIRKKKPPKMYKDVSQAVMNMQPKKDISIPKASTQHSPEPPISRSPSSQDHYLVLTGHGNKDKTHSNEVVAVNLSRNYQSISLGYIQAEFAEGTKCCIYKGSLYVCGLGSTMDEIWKFQLQERSASKHSRLTVPRRNHGMTTHNKGCLYIVGGYSPYTLGHKDMVEAVDPGTATQYCKEVGHLKHYICPYGLHVFQIASGDLALTGIIDKSRHTTLQLWSPSTASITASVSLGQCVAGVYGVVECYGHLIVIAESATVICRVKDILEDKPHNVTLSDMYKSPNHGCAVVLTPQDDILLLGGQQRLCGGSAACGIYKASAHDVINNTGRGWQPLSTECSLKDFRIFGYDTTSLPLQE